MINTTKNGQTFVRVSCKKDIQMPKNATTLENYKRYFDRFGSPSAFSLRENFAGTIIYRLRATVLVIEDVEHKIRNLIILML